MIDTERGRHAPRTILSGASVVLPDRILHPGTVVIEDGRIASVEPGSRPSGSDPGLIDCTRHYIVPGFIDVHVHGLEGADALDGAGGVAALAARLPRYGVTAFCPTSIACAPDPLREMLDGDPRRPARGPAARACCPRTSKATSSTRSTAAPSRSSVCACRAARWPTARFTGDDILAVIRRSACETSAS